MMYGYGGGAPGAPGNLGGVGAPVSFAGGVSPSVRVSGGNNPTSVAVPDISLGGGGNLNNAGMMERARAMTAKYAAKYTGRKSVGSPSKASNSISDNIPSVPAVEVVVSVPSNDASSRIDICESTNDEEMQILHQPQQQPLLSGSGDLKSEPNISKTVSTQSQHDKIGIVDDKGLEEGGGGRGLVYKGSSFGMSFLPTSTKSQTASSSASLPTHPLNPWYLSRGMPNFSRVGTSMYTDAAGHYLGPVGYNITGDSLGGGNKRKRTDIEVLNKSEKNEIETSMKKVLSENSRSVGVHWGSAEMKVWDEFRQNCRGTTNGNCSTTNIESIAGSTASDCKRPSDVIKKMLLEEKQKGSAMEKLVFDAITSKNKSPPPPQK